MKNDVNEYSSASNIVGHQLSKKNKEKKIDELSSLFLRKILTEFIRKQEGEESYCLYSPKPSKEKIGKKIACFPTRIQAQEKEVLMFPPRDKEILQRKKEDIEKKKKRKFKSVNKREAIERLHESIFKILKEQFVNKVPRLDNWDSFLQKIPKNVLLNNEKIKEFYKNIATAKKTALKQSIDLIEKELKKVKVFNVKSSNFLEDKDKHEIYMSFDVQLKNSKDVIGPIYIRIDSVTLFPKIIYSDKAVNQMKVFDLHDANLLKGLLLSIDDNILVDVTNVKRAIGKRDEFLDKLYEETEDSLNDKDLLALSMLQKLMKEKYKVPRR